jgi:hypothetical protein
MVDAGGCRTGLRRLVVATALVQLYTVAAYLCAVVVPHLWRGLPAPPELIVVPGALIFLPGFFVADVGASLMGWIALYGAVILVVQYRPLPVRPRRWLTAGTAASAAACVVMSTPTGVALGAATFG